MAGKRSSNGNTSTGSQSHLAHAEETGFARPCHAVTIYTGRQKTKAKAQPRILWTRRHLLVLWFLDMPIQMCWTFGDSPTACRDAMNVLRDEKIGFYGQLMCKQRS